jgi:RND family efflux transporter MFP subunit
MWYWFAGLLGYLVLAAQPAGSAALVPPPPPAYVVQEARIVDQKSVFATVESAYVVPARVRTGGTILKLNVRQGDQVDRGQVIAFVGDKKLALRVNAYQAQVQAAQAQLEQAKLEFERAERLIAAGTISREAHDRARTAYDVAQSNLKSVLAQRAVVRQEQTEGEVLAPTAGRVITVPVTAGTVVMAGDAVATIAEQDFVLRLKVPERHAGYLHVGDPVRLDGEDLGSSGPRFGEIRLIYPQVEDGHVVADAAVAGLADYFIGRRMRVWVPAGAREAIVVPAGLITTRFGIDYAKVWTPSSGAIDVPVQRGEPWPTPEMPDGLEILSGLKAGDRLLSP